MTKDSNTTSAAPGRGALPATPQRLSRLLSDERKPLLWVGAGASIAAGYPSTYDLTQQIREAAEPGDITDSLEDFTQVVDAFVAANGRGELADLLQDAFQPRKVASFHRTLARLVKAGGFSAIVTTNYDDLLERAMAEEQSAYVLKTLESNFDVHPGSSTILMKIHGSLSDWKKVVLSGRSYAEFESRYKRLLSRLDDWLSMYRVIFVGCSMQDPRILDWLRGLSDERAGSLKRWHPIMTEADWRKAWEVGAQREDVRENGVPHALLRGAIRPLVLNDYSDLPRLWDETLALLRPGSTGDVASHREPVEISVTPNEAHKDSKEAPSEESFRRKAPQAAGTGALADREESRLIRIARTYAENQLRSSERPPELAQLVPNDRRFDAATCETTFDALYVEPRLASLTELNELDRQYARLANALQDDSASPERRASLRRRLIGLDRKRWHRLRKMGKEGRAGDQLKEHSAVILLGDPGGGKSSLLRWRLRRDCLKLVRGQRSAIPVLVPLPDYARWWTEKHKQGLPRSLTAFLCSWCGHEQEGLTEAIQWALEDSGSGLHLYLDGLDEVEHRVRPPVVQEVQGFIAENVRVGNQNRIVVASRRLGYFSAPLNLSLPHLRLLPFSRREVSSFVNQWYSMQTEPPESDDDLRDHLPKTAAGELLNRICDGGPMEALASTPLLLSLTIQIADNSGRLPTNVVEIYDPSLKALLTRWEKLRKAANNDILLTTAGISYQEACRLWGAIARGMHEDGDIVLYGDELHQRLKSELQRQGRTESADEWLSVRGDQSCLLEEKGPDLFGFLHRSFQEYLVALELNDEQEMHRHLDDPHWQDVISLALGIMGSIRPRQTQRVVDFLRSVLNRNSKYEKMLHVDLFLVASFIADGVNPGDECVREILGHLVCVLTSDELEEIRAEAGDWIVECVPVLLSRLKKELLQITRDLASAQDLICRVVACSCVEEVGTSVWAEVLPTLAADHRAAVRAMALAAEVRLTGTLSPSLLDSMLELTKEVWTFRYFEDMELDPVRPLLRDFAAQAKSFLGSLPPRQAFRVAIVLLKSSERQVASETISRLLWTDDLRTRILALATGPRIGLMHDAQRSLIRLVGSLPPKIRREILAVLLGRHDPLRRPKPMDQLLASLKGHPDPAVQADTIELLLRTSLHEEASERAYELMVHSEIPEEARLRLLQHMAIWCPPRHVALQAIEQLASASSETWKTLRRLIAPHQDSLAPELLEVLESTFPLGRLRAAVLLRGSDHDERAHAVWRSALESGEEVLEEMADSDLPPDLEIDLRIRLWRQWLTSGSRRRQLRAANLLYQTTLDDSALATIRGRTEPGSELRIEAARALANSQAHQLEAYEVVVDVAIEQMERDGVISGEVKNLLELWSHFPTTSSPFIRVFRALRPGHGLDVEKVFSRVTDFASDFAAELDGDSRTAEPSARLFIARQLLETTYVIHAFRELASVARCSDFEESALAVMTMVLSLNLEEINFGESLWAVLTDSDIHIRRRSVRTIRELAKDILPLMSFLERHLPDSCDELTASNNFYEAAWLRAELARNGPGETLGATQPSLDEAVSQRQEEELGDPQMKAMRAIEVTGKRSHASQFDQLRAFVTEHISDSATIGVICADAGIPVERISWEQTTEVIWLRVFDEVAAQGEQVAVRFANVLLRRYPRNERLAQLLAENDHRL